MSPQRTVPTSGACAPFHVFGYKWAALSVNDAPPPHFADMTLLAVQGRQVSRSPLSPRLSVFREHRQPCPSAAISSSVTPPSVQPLACAPSAVRPWRTCSAQAAARRSALRGEAGRVSSPLVPLLPPLQPPFSPAVATATTPFPQSGAVRAALHTRRTRTPQRHQGQFFTPRRARACARQLRRVPNEGGRGCPSQRPPRLTGWVPRGSITACSPPPRALRGRSRGGHLHRGKLRAAGAPVPPLTPRLQACTRIPKFTKRTE